MQENKEREDFETKRRQSLLMKSATVVPVQSQPQLTGKDGDVSSPEVDHLATGGIPSVLNPRMAADMVPNLVAVIVSQLFTTAKLTQLEREELLDLTAVLYSNPLTKDRLLHFASRAVAESEIPEGTVAGDLLRCLAEARTHGLATEDFGIHGLSSVTEDGADDRG